MLPQPKNRFRAYGPTAPLTDNRRTLIVVFLSGIAPRSASDYAYCYIFLRRVVCLSLGCHTRASCFNRSTDFDAIWQVHLWGSVTHCVRWGSFNYLQGGEVWGRTPSQHADEHCCGHLANNNEGLAIPPFTKLLWFLFILCLSISKSINRKCLLRYILRYDAFFFIVYIIVLLYILLHNKLFINTCCSLITSKIHYHRPMPGVAYSLISLQTVV